MRTSYCPRTSRCSDLRIDMSTLERSSTSIIFRSEDSFSRRMSVSCARCSWLLSSTKASSRLCLSSRSPSITLSNAPICCLKSTNSCCTCDILPSIKALSAANFPPTRAAVSAFARACESRASSCSRFPLPSSSATWFRSTSSACALAASSPCASRSAHSATVPSTNACSRATSALCAAPIDPSRDSADAFSSLPILSSASLCPPSISLTTPEWLDSSSDTCPARAAFSADSSAPSLSLFSSLSASSDAAVLCSFCSKPLRVLTASSCCAARSASAPEWARSSCARSSDRPKSD
mmetsp:Transcript_27847/g.61657  ORF Transcript_27847/g.61657 Transcript_27847/m.61657 type:complete len:294 (-) Transcript_27847:426-1307(-)